MFATGNVIYCDDLIVLCPVHRCEYKRFVILIQFYMIQHLAIYFC